MPFSPENPFAGPDGHPDYNVAGALTNAIAWERAKELKRRESLPPEERKRLEEADERWARKMQSSVGD